MFFRDIITEAALTAVELTKNDAKYLRLLVGYGDKTFLPVTPEKRAEFGNTVALSKNSLRDLKAALNSDDVVGNVQQIRRITVQKEDGSVVTAPLGIFFKGTEFKGKENKKLYNAGHLAELFMGLSVSAKFLSQGKDVTADQVKNIIKKSTNRIDGKNYVFELSQSIKYPEINNKNDTLKFLARVPAKSAEEFIKQSNTMFDADLNAVLNSAVRYVNEAGSVASSVERVRKDKNNNIIDVVSDGTTDAKGTKADLILKVDNKKVNLLSLKTYSTDTLGQFSGLTFANLYKWFMYNFGIDITPYKKNFDPSMESEKIYKNLLNLYDKIIYPQVEMLVEKQKPNREAAIVKQFARAANIYARGENLENVEVVKLDDKVPVGNYKVLRFSDDLAEAMKKFDLEVRYVSGGQGRTIQIWVKPAANEKAAKGAKLCQFRTQKMGDSYRNYFESGPMLEALTVISKRDDNIRKLK